jgi:hypothetical protein
MAACPQNAPTGTLFNHLRHQAVDELTSQSLIIDELKTHCVFEDDLLMGVAFRVDETPKKDIDEARQAVHCSTEWEQLLGATQGMDEEAIYEPLVSHRSVRSCSYAQSLRSSRRPS